VRIEIGGQLVAEDQVEERRDDRLREDKAPCDQEADVGMKSTRAIGIEAAGRRQVAAKLPDADGDQQACDQRQQDGERQAPASVRSPDDDGECDRRCWRHVGD